MKTVTLNKKNILDFAKERNLKLASSDDEWVFFLDSDEKPDPVLRKEIKDIAKQDAVNGYYIKRKNYFLDTFVGEEWLVRVGRKGAGKWERRVHEVWKIKGKLGNLKGYIKHNTAGSISEMLSKINKYSGLHALENKQRRKKSSIVKIGLFPIFKFAESLIKRRGLVFSILQSFHSFLAWSKQWELSRK